MKDNTENKVKTDVLVYSIFTNSFGFVGCFSNRTQIINHLKFLDADFCFSYDQLRNRINVCDVGKFIDVGKYRIYKTLMNKGVMIPTIF
jgi:hypothetical protein